MTETQQAATASSGFNRPDPFNYPMPQRADCMSLSTINANKDGMKTTTFKFATGRGNSQNLNTRDIDGAVPKLHGSKPQNEGRAQYHMQNFDIERSAPRQLHIQLNKPENNMKISDIGGAQPQCVKFKSTRSGFNPLNPDYNLQSVTYLEPEKLRFIRDQQNISDIEGTKPVRKKNEDYKTRDVMAIGDIEGTQATIRHPDRPVKNQQYDPINYRDVTHADFKTKRCTNPLQPTYMFRANDEKTLVEIGAVAGSTPCVLPPPRQDQNYVKTSLTTADIHGCAIGTKGLHNFHTRERRGHLKSCVTTDIFGAQPGSLKKAPVTLRDTNPLDPNYQMPGRNELTNINDAFGKPRPKPLSKLQQAAQMALNNNPSSSKPLSPPTSSAPKSTAQKLDSFVDK